jgi:pimeloyl-ACP methyl ester carboxylesterase
MAGDQKPEHLTRSAEKTWPGQAEYLAAYDAVLAQWPVAVESADLSSPFGTTHVTICGPRDGEPLALLHGGGSTSTVWFANVGELSRTHRVYAVDTIGEAGRSVNDGRPVDGLAGFMDWLDGLFDALDLDSASLSGHSYGGWLRRPAPDRLRASTVPTLLLLAEQSRAHDVHQVSANARRLMPHVVSTILPDVSHHAMPTEQREQLNRELGTFLS